MNNPIEQKIEELIDRRIDNDEGLHNLFKEAITFGQEIKAEEVRGWIEKNSISICSQHQSWNKDCSRCTTAAVYLKDAIIYLSPNNNTN